MTRSEMLPFRDRSTESAVLAPYDYHPERTYSNGGTHLVSERHTYQHSRFNRHPDYREILSHPTMEQESKYGFRNQSMGSNYSNNLPSHENQRDWSSWRNESASQITPSSSYDDSRRRSSNVNYNLSYPERPPTYDNQRKFWQPESSRASSPIWRSRTQKWPPRAPVISNSSILRPRPFPEPLVRHKIEPSYMWKRPMQEDHERKTRYFWDSMFVKWYLCNIIFIFFIVEQSSTHPNDLEYLLIITLRTIDPETMPRFPFLHTLCRMSQTADFNRFPYRNRNRSPIPLFDLNHEIVIEIFTVPRITLDGHHHTIQNIDPFIEYRREFLLVRGDHLLLLNHRLKPHVLTLIIGVPRGHAAPTVAAPAMTAVKHATRSRISG